MIYWIVGLLGLVLIFIILLEVFPSKRYMSDIYQDMYLQQREQTKILRDMRNVFFAKSRKNKREGR